MISNWIRSFFNCFDQSLESINGLFMFSNKQERNRFEFFSCEKVDFKIWTSHQALGFLREWNKIAIILISDCSVNKCNPLSIYCISGVVLPRSVVCSWGGQDQYSWCVFCQRECVSWRVQGHYFGGLCVVIWFDYLVDYSMVFWGLDVAVGLRVNQYKL